MIHLATPMDDVWGNLGRSIFNFYIQWIIDHSGLGVSW